jgi:hypothetical protein
MRLIKAMTDNYDSPTVNSEHKLFRTDTFGFPICYNMITFFYYIN